VSDDRHIDLSALAERPVAVLGLGKSGLAAAQALQNSGVEVWAWDDGAEARDSAITSGVALRSLETAPLGAANFMVLSPGIPHTYPAPHRVVQLARDARCEIVCDIEILVRTQSAARIVGITGTNGKSTTTALLGHILAESGGPVAVGGNLGVPALALPALERDGTYVLELSSYQLELVPSAVFDTAILLNISEDHLDRHGGLEGYVAAKKRIFAGQRPGQTAIIGVDDEFSQKIFSRLAETGSQTVVPISAHGSASGGVYAENGWLIDDRYGAAVRIIEIGRVQTLPGWHNAQNAAAAYAAAAAMGMVREAIAARIASYPGLAHRQELVDVVDGVLYVNDSKATNADAAARALECYDDVLWIAGGRAKAGGISSLANYFPKVRHALLIGEAADEFALNLAGQVPVTQSGDLAHAVDNAARLVGEARDSGEPGPKVVLLSPACASFDQFANFEARGNAFRDAVMALAGAHTPPDIVAGGVA